MIFKRLFHQVRGTSGAPTPTETAVITPLVPMTASELAALQAAAVSATDPAAAVQYRTLLCDVTPAVTAPVDAAMALAAVATLDDVTLLATIAREAQLPDLRRAALSRLPPDSDVLAECAVSDASAANRLLALERLAHRAGLEYVSKHIGKRDSHVYRVARDKLRTLAQHEARVAWVRQRAQALCDEVARLGRHQLWAQDRALLAHLQQQWREIAAEATPAEQAQFTAAGAAFLALCPAANPVEPPPVVAVPVTAPVTTAPVTPVVTPEPPAAAVPTVTRESLLAQLTALNTSTLAAPELAAQLAALTAQWQALEHPAGTESESDAAAQQQQFQASVAQLTERQQVATGQQMQRLAQLQQDIERLLVQGSIVDQPVMQQFRQRFERWRGGADTEPVTAQCRAVLQQLEQRFTRQRQHVTRRLSATIAQLAALERHLTSGELRKAEPLYQKITATLDHAHAAGIPRADIVALERQLKQLAPQLRELQHWRRWSVSQHREALCHEAEALVAAANEDFATQTRQARALQRAWQQLDHAGTPPDDAFRSRFRSALDQVLARCQPYLAERATAQAAQHHARLALCEELETFLAKVDWERVDWKQMVQAEREMRHAWAALGSSDERGGRALESRFWRSLERVDRVLHEERRHNLALKRDLIQRMEALTAVPSVEAALAQARALQQQWHTTVPGRRRDENALWTAFRTACEHVANRRQVERTQRVTTQQEQLTQREAVCAAAEQVLTQPLPAAALLTAWEQVEQQWTQLTPPPHRAVEQRWRTVRTAVLARYQRAAAQEQWQLLQQLAAFAALSDHVGSALFAAATPPTPAALTALAAELTQRWAALLPGTDGQLHAALAARRDLINAALTDAAARDQLQAQWLARGEQRAQLCLQLEILTQLPSPPELLSARLELQVARLQEKIHTGEATTLPADSWALLQAWYWCAPAATPAPVMARFERILAAVQPSSE